MSKNSYTQLELLDIMQRYNSIDRQTIKNNLQIVKEVHRFQNADIVNDFGYKEEKLKGWFNRSNPVVPIFEDALRMAVHYGFDIIELIGKKEGENMLKIFHLSDMMEDEVLDRTIKLLKLGHNKFKYDNNETIIFRSEDHDEISKYLGISMNHATTLKEYIENFDGGGYLQINHHIQIGQSECIEKMQESFEKYEDQIWKAENFRVEILKIIQEQAYKVFLDLIKDGFEIINNGNFKWE